MSVRTSPPAGDPRCAALVATEGGGHVTNCACVNYGQCRAIIPPNPAACGKKPTHLVTFQDGDKLAVCVDCALRLGQLAGSHGRILKTEKLKAPL